MDKRDELAAEMDEWDHWVCGEYCRVAKRGSGFTGNANYSDWLECARLMAGPEEHPFSNRVADMLDLLTDLDDEVSAMVANIEAEKKRLEEMTNAHSSPPRNR